MIYLDGKYIHIQLTSTPPSPPRPIAQCPRKPGVCAPRVNPIPGQRVDSSRDLSCGLKLQRGQVASRPATHPGAPEHAQTAERQTVNPTVARWDVRLTKAGILVVETSVQLRCSAS